MKLIPFHELTSEDQALARRRYTHKHDRWAVVAEHYYYPVKKNGRLGHGYRQMGIPLRFLLNADYMKSLGYTDQFGE